MRAHSVSRSSFVTTFIWLKKRVPVISLPSFHFHGPTAAIKAQICKSVVQALEGWIFGGGSQCRPSAESARAARLASITAEDDRRRKRAEQLGLPWPRLTNGPRLVAPPARRTTLTPCYSEVSKASDLSLVSKTCPPWWMRGKPLVPTAEDFVDVVAGIEVKEEEEKKNEETDEDEDDNKTEEQDQEKDESHEEGPPKKRLRAPLTTTPLQYKAWFVRFDAIQRKRFSWSTTQTLRCAQQLAPEIFSQVHKDTHRRWPQQIGWRGGALGHRSGRRKPRSH